MADKIRFIGKDRQGDNVYELPNGNYFGGEFPDVAAVEHYIKTFPMADGMKPGIYVGQYGPIVNA